MDSTTSTRGDLRSPSIFQMHPILDARFPDGKGLSLCSQLRQLDPHTPIVVYSGAVYGSDREEAERAGATAFVPKPDIELLVETDTAAQTIKFKRVGT